jgi:exopolyphosphatase/guanosine-5'-triphosphate,3'-diphosphate pyrophosphatase
MRPVAAIDCGTNSTRLLVVDAHGRTVDRRMRITRLGQGVDAGGRVVPEAVERVTAVLAEYRAAMEEHHVDPADTMLVATSAARDAANRDELFAALRDAAGVEPTLLTGDAEARLSFTGATADLPPGPVPVLVADIGGGSTELVVGTPGEEPHAAVSLDVGSVRLTERWFEADPPGPEALANAIGEVRDALADADVLHPELATAERFLGLAGTVTTVAALDQGLLAYDRDAIHHYDLTREAAEDWFRTMAMATRDERLGNPGLEEARADVIVGGMCVLQAIFRHYDLERCLVSEADILDGVAAAVRSRIG